MPAPGFKKATLENRRDCLCKTGFQTYLRGHRLVTDRSVFVGEVAVHIGRSFVGFSGRGGCVFGLVAFARRRSLVTGPLQSFSPVVVLGLLVAVADLLYKKGLFVSVFAFSA